MFACGILGSGWVASTVDRDSLESRAGHEVARVLARGHMVPVEREVVVTKERAEVTRAGARHPVGILLLVRDRVRGHAQG